MGQSKSLQIVDYAIHLKQIRAQPRTLSINYTLPNQFNSLQSCNLFLAISSPIAHIIIDMPTFQYSPVRHYSRHQVLRQSTLLPIILLAIAFVVAFLTHFTAHPPAPRLILRSLPEEKPPHQCFIKRRSPLYVFVHLHKTAGNHLKTALFGFAKRNAINLHHTCHQTMGDSTLQSFWFNRQKPTNSVDCNLDQLASMNKVERDALDFVMGHQFVGAHDLFPGRDVRYFTFMRHPLLRKTSHFIHFENNANMKSLAEYLVERNRNYMTKRLATDTRPSEVTADLRARFVDVDNFAARAALRAAKRNIIQRFFFVGLVERYRESICLLDKLLMVACGRNGRLARMGLNLDKISNERENWRGKTERWVNRLNTDVKNAALRAEGADVQLYKFAEALFESKLNMYPECREQ